MMKRILKHVMVIALVAFAFSCEDFDPAPQYTKSDADFMVTSSVTSVAVTAADSLNNVITFTWDDPKYSLGLDKSKFTIKVGAKGENFSKVVTKEFSSVLTGALTGKELNGMALVLGGIIGQPIELQTVVVASQTNNNEPKNSNVITITVTPYGDLGLTPSSTAIVIDAAKPSDAALTLTWTPAFVGYSGVKTYELQYAEGGSDFSDPTVSSETSLSKSFTNIALNKIALAQGIAPGEEGMIDFRVKSINENGAIVYSNVATVKVTPYISYTTIGLIGDATPGGWDIDTDMHRPDPDKPTEWSVIIYLEGGKAAKFRAEDSWNENWGNSDFPSGTGTQNGPNIPISTSGYYKVNINVGTGEYSFTTVSTTVYTSVSLTGDQSGWVSDIADLTKDPDNDQIWSGTVELEAGELKFRANHDWGTNWGAASDATSSNLSGYVRNGGPNMVIPADGDYFVYINVATGDYFFGKSDRSDPYNDIGVIGSATAGGWSDDTNLIKNPSNPYKWSGILTLTEGEAKFRADNDWGVNWGASGFPSGTGTSGGPDIPVSEEGSYFITFNTSTGEYTFTK